MTKNLGAYLIFGKKAAGNLDGKAKICKAKNSES